MAYVAPSIPAVGDQITAYQGAIIAADLAAGPNMGTPTTTASTGTVTSAATEIRDAVLGNYVFTSVAGRRYRVIVDGLQMQASVAGDITLINVRNGGASTPTTASTVVAVGRVWNPGVTLPIGVPVADTFVPGAGTQTLSVFTQRVGGTGVDTPTGTRELYVVDIGPA